ncbi:fibronectin type III domain-containing protein [Gracilibacillus sp. HCP3S3_G5_2]|uniref:fibronectin type III domain-containing protein n=1 Tax=Gracilibacillus sp. HCP3S3_G5_2 TaxID=3438941 RepID=UPI003F8C273E
MTASNITDTSLTLTWDAVSYNEGIEEYEIYRNGNSIGTRKGTSLTDSGLTAETTYEYQVKAIGSNGVESPLSDALSVTTDSEPEPDPEPEDPPEEPDNE